MNQTPKYVYIAVDLANKIKTNKIKEGQKIKGRSIASATYNVSTETMRKALSLLVEHGVVTVIEKSGFVVTSRDAAKDFVKHHNKDTKISDEFLKMNHLIKQQKELENELNRTLKRIQQKVYSQRQEIPFDYITIPISEDCFCVDQSILSLDFYQQTGATLFGIVSQGKPLSVDLNYIVKPADILYFSGNNETFKELVKYINTTK